MRLRIIHIVLVFSLWAQVALAQCFLESPVIIAPERTTDVLIEVSDLVIADLADGQKLCVVYAEWEHGKQENLRIDLVSPSGQVVTLAGPGIQGGGLSPNVNWNVSFVLCDQPPSPDAGFDPVWDNAQAWQFLGNYTGAYFPHNGCLADFNMGSANGPWHLLITNLGTTTGTLIYFELQFCDDSGIACDLCTTYAGEWAEDYLPVCSGDPALAALTIDYTLDPEIDGDDSYLYGIEIPNGDFILTEALMNADTLAPGDYRICGIAFDASAESAIMAVQNIGQLETLSNSGNCIDITDNCFTLSIQESSTVVRLEHNLCPGEEVELEGQIYKQATDTIYYSTADPFLPCDTAWHIVVREVELISEIAEQNTPLVCGQRLFLDGSASTSSVAAVSSYQWSTSDGNIISGVGPLATIDQQGSYYLEVSDGFCTSRDTIQVIGIDTFFVRLEQESALCAEDPLIINVVDSFDVTLGPISFGISGICGPNTGTITVTSQPIVEVTLPGEYIIKTEAGSCSRSDTIFVTGAGQPIPFSVTVSDTLDCDMQPVFFDFVTPVTPTNIFYDGPQLIPPNTTNPSIQEAGMYTITIYDENSCSAETTVEVIAENIAPQVAVADVSLWCSASSATTMLTADITGAYDEVLWVGPDGAEYDVLEPVVSDTGRYILTVVGDNGCVSEEATLQFTIINDTLPYVGEDLSAELLCLGDSLELSLPPAIQYSSIYWLDAQGNLLGNGDSQFYAEPGSYSVLIDSPQDCTRELAITLGLHPEWDILNGVGIESVRSDCDGIGEIHLEDFDAVTNLYINGEALEPAAVMPLDFNTVELTLESEQSCIRDTVLKIYSLDSPVVDLGPDVTLNLGESYLLPTSPDVPMPTWTLDWSEEGILSCTACLTPNVTPTETTTLSLIVLDNNGCSTEKSIILTVIDQDNSELDLEPGYYVPNVLLMDSQNGNGLDNTLIMGLDPLKFNFYEFYLYDRWGSLIVSQNGSVDGSSTITLWDGTLDGLPVLSGVYPYMAKLLHVSGEEQIISGHISLLR